MKIYISGKISGLPIKNVIEKFKWHAAFLEMKGHTPINPIEVSPFNDKKTDVIIWLMIFRPYWSVKRYIW